MSSGVPNSIVEARQTWKHASAALNKAIIEALPLGTIVEVTLGGRRITGRVNGHPQDWSARPGHFSIENVATGKTRHSICPVFHDLTIIELPAEKGGAE